MNTGLYRDIVYTEYMLEHDLTWEQMQQQIHVDEMLKRVAHMEWQDEQRAAWMSGESPQYTVPEDCPFWCVAIKHMGMPTANVRPHISGSHKTFKVSDALLFKSNLSSDPVLIQFAGGGVV